MTSGTMDEKKNNPTLTLPTRGGKPDDIRHNGRKKNNPTLTLPTRGGKPDTIRHNGRKEDAGLKTREQD